MKQNVITNTLYTLADTLTAILLYAVFPIIPLYVFITLLTLIMASTALKRHGLAAAVLITYVILAFITALGHASLLIMPLLLTTYLITEAGIVNDIAVASWTLLFTPLYWLSIPLSIAPSIKGYSVRSAIIFALLTFLYAVGAAYQGITWLPITAIHVVNLDLVRGMESLIFDSSGSLLTLSNELSNVMLYFVLIVVMTIPPLVGRYLPRLIMTWSVSTDISQIIMNLTPQLVTASILYAPLISGNTWNYYVTPLLIIGSFIIGLGTYALDITQSKLKVGVQSIMSARKKSPIVIPIIDPLMITEYSYWVKKLPKDDADLVNTVVNTLSKTGIAALYASLPQDKIEIIAKALFGLTRTKGFIIKGNIDELTNDVEWFIKAHEKALLVLISNEINKDMFFKLIDYNRRTKLYALIINSDDGIVDKLRKYGIEVINYGAVEGTEKEQRQTKYVEEVPSKQVGAADNAISNAPNNPALINEEVIHQASVNAPIGVETATAPTKAVNENEVIVKKDNEVTTNLPLEKGVTKEEKALETPKVPARKERAKDEVVKERPKARSKSANVNVMVAIDPIDLISMNTKSKLIDYIDSSIRLRDMMRNLGLRYMASIMIIGPPKSGKTALINHVAKHLGVTIIDYKDPSISIIDNAIIHVPNLETAINEDLNYVLKLLSIARAKHLVVVFESSNPWSIDPEFVKKNIDAVIPVLPAHDEYIDEVIENKLKVSDRDRDVIKGIIKSCPAIEAIEKIRLYLSSRDSTSIICEDTFRKYQDFAQSFSV